MTELEKNLKNTSLNFLNHWIASERNVYKRKLLKEVREFKLLSSYPNYSEKIRVIKDEKINNFTGFINYNSSIVDKLNTCSRYFTRGFIEYDPDYRQIIGNGILVKKDGDKKFYGLFERKHGKKDAKSTLGKVGMIGGHINNKDKSIELGFVRELFEELKGLEYNNITSIEPIGFIREVNEKIEISNHHICVLYLVHVSDSETNKISNFQSDDYDEKLIWVEESKAREILESNASYVDNWVRHGLNHIINDHKS